MTRALVLATPHRRHDALEAALRTTHGFDVVRLRGPEDLDVDRLQRLKPRCIFFPHWSWIVPAEIHGAFECVIFHMTDLPFGRGGSPLQNLIARRIYETQLSALKCDAGLDTGPVYLKMPLSLHGSAEEIFLRAATLMETMIVAIMTESPTPTPQTGTPVIFARRRPEDGALDTLEDLVSVHDAIRMLDAEGYPPAFVCVGGLRFEFSRSRLDHDAVTADVKITLVKQGT